MAFELRGDVRGGCCGRVTVSASSCSRPGSMEAMRGREARAGRPRLRHVALDVADIDAACAAAPEAGGTAGCGSRPSHEPGRRMAFVHDPAGNLVELLGG
jgi:catechol 2,3-dioxygenase-like lactoylglutathione lyase family enzyme